MYVNETISRQCQALLRLETIVLVPYTSNPGFVGRVDILEKLKTRLDPMLRPDGATIQARAALFGLGGIGYAGCWSVQNRD